MTNQTVRVLPVKGRRVRDPESRRVLGAEGLDVVLAGYWSRRLEAGDIEVAKPKAAGPQSNSSSGGK